MADGRWASATSRLNTEKLKLGKQIKQGGEKDYETADHRPWLKAESGNLRTEIPVAASNETTQHAWFCLRSQPKHEHIAASHLRQLAELEVFLPRVRFQRKTRQGMAWVTEALFPNYLFARFNWKSMLRLVHHTPGVAGVVHFGIRWPTIADNVIEELRRLFGNDQLHVISTEPKVGDAVQIVGGVFHDLEAVVTRVMPARERVTVLLEFLGRQTAVELPLGSVIREGNERERVF